jgi:uncharacterized protein (DUF58 family)
MRPNSVSAPPRGRLRLTSAGLAWLAAAMILGGVLGWFKSLNLLLVLAYAMLVLLILNGVLARRHAGRVQAKRIPLPPVFVGEEVSIAIVVANVDKRAASVEIQDGTARWMVEFLPAGGSVECTQSRRYVRRGPALLPPIIVGSAFPFGFIRYEREQGEPAKVVVLPALGHADADGLRRWVLKQAGSEGRSRKVLRRDTPDLADVRGVRPYRPGDSIRAIHWRTSARRRQLVVREYDSAPSPDLVVVVEPWLPAQPKAADGAALEAALCLAATVIHTWRQAIETHVTVVVSGVGIATGTALPGEAGTREALVPLAEAQGAADFAAVPPTAFGRRLGHAARLVISSRAGSPLAERLAQSTGKHFLVLDPLQRLPWYQEPVSPRTAT